jgi:hypothetical protein
VKWLVIALALAALGTGLRAAHLWYLSADVVPIPLWEKDGIAKPDDPEEVRLGWVGAELIAIKKAARLNSRAARWTASSVAISTACAIAGALTNSN